jgi:hypothetical protein
MPGVDNRLCREVRRGVEMTIGGNPSELHSRLHAVWPSIAENDVTWFLYTSAAVYCPQIGGPV